MAKFALGRLLMTTNLQNRLAEEDPQGRHEELRGLFARHASGDWGHLDDEDTRLNNEALEHGGRLLSAYTTTTGIKLWIITEADRSATTALLPEDY